MFESMISEVNLKDLVALAETAPEGKFVEIGVFKGGSAIRLYQLALQQDRELHLFDTFSGIPNFTEGLDHFKKGIFNPGPNIVNFLTENMPLATFHVGIYPGTHPKDFNGVAFLHVDCDQYESYQAVLAQMWPCVVPGGIMLFDDYPYLAGAKKAVEEVFDVSALQKIGEHFYATKEVKACD